MKIWEIVNLIALEPNKTFCQQLVFEIVVYTHSNYHGDKNKYFINFQYGYYLKNISFFFNIKLFWCMLYYDRILNNKNIDDKNNFFELETARFLQKSMASFDGSGISNRTMSVIKSISLFCTLSCKFSADEYLGQAAVGAPKIMIFGNQFLNNKFCLGSQCSCRGALCCQIFKVRLKNHTISSLYLFKAHIVNLRFYYKWRWWRHAWRHFSRLNVFNVALQIISCWIYVFWLIILLEAIGWFQR